MKVANDVTQSLGPFEKLKNESQNKFKREVKVGVGKVKRKRSVKKEGRNALGENGVREKDVKSG